MSFIKFPNGMSLSSIKDGFIIMVYNPESKDGKPNTISIDEIKKFFTGVIDTGEDRFITGNDLKEYIEENTISTNPKLNGQLAMFDSLGQLTGGGDFNQFEKAFIDGLNTESIFK